MTKMTLVWISHSRVSKILLTILTISSIGCGPGWADLPGDYHVHRYSSDQVYVAPLHQHPASPVIPSKVIGLWWSDSWIVGECNPMMRRSKNPVDNYMIADETRTEYWIIDLKNEKSHGPYLNRDLFENAVAKLKVSDTPLIFREPPFTRKH